MKTAVEWLFEQLDIVDSSISYEYFKQANKMFEEQIRRAYYTGGDDIKDNPGREAEQYYNETFKQQEQ